MPGMQHGGLWAKFMLVPIRGRALFKHPLGVGADIQPAEALPQMRASMIQKRSRSLSLDAYGVTEGNTHSNTLVVVVVCCYY